MSVSAPSGRSTTRSGSPYRSSSRPMRKRKDRPMADAVEPAVEKPKKPKRKLPRGVIVQDGAYYAQYFCAGCPKHAPTLPREKRRHRECAGTAPSLARDLHTKRKNEIREGRFFPEPDRRGPLDATVSDAIDRYLADNKSRLDAYKDADRFGRYWKDALKGKTLRQVEPHDVIVYR